MVDFLWVFGMKRPQGTKRHSVRIQDLEHLVDIEDGLDGDRRVIRSYPVSQISYNEDLF